jgi:5-amino-6-(5-phosphoribosylamino)uracil reductase
VRVFSNLAISLDGKIAQSDYPTRPLGTPYDRKMMQVIRAQADVVLVGAGTLRAHPHCFKIQKLKKNKRQLANGVVTASGDLDSKIDFFNDPTVVRFVFTTERGLKRAEEAAQERAFVVSCGKDSVDPKLVLKRLKESQLTQVLVEGGGELMASFLKAQALDELYVTHTPVVLGGRSNPSLVGGDASLNPWGKLKILKIKRVKNELYAHYKVLRSKVV